MGPGGPGRGGQPGMSAEDREKERKRRQEEQKRKQEAGPQRIGRKKKKQGVDNSHKLPQSKRPINYSPISSPDLEVQTQTFETGTSERLYTDGAGVHSEPRTTQALRLKEGKGATYGRRDPWHAPSSRKLGRNHR